jgi:hypothetical protein
MAEHRYDTNWDANERKAMQIQPEQLGGIIVLLVLGIGIAVALALMFAPKEKKKPGLAGELEYRINRMEKDLSQLSKKIQERVKEMT